MCTCIVLQGLTNLRQLSLARSWYTGSRHPEDSLFKLTQLRDLSFGLHQDDDCRPASLDMSHAYVPAMAQLTRLCLASFLENSEGLTHWSNLVVLDLSSSGIHEVLQGQLMHGGVSMILAVAILAAMSHGSSFQGNIHKFIHYLLNLMLGRFMHQIAVWKVSL